ncbi:MAG: hypothetical protein AMXMBFR37_07060 [Steroidobacteraceae bacterium]
MAQGMDRDELEPLQRQLARQLLAHEVRTGLIHLLTGLSEWAIRGLYREQGGQSTGEGEGPARHRGKTPSQITFLWRSESTREAAVLFVCVWEREAERLKLEAVQSGLAERLRITQGFCDAFALFEQFWPEAPLTMEQAYTLIRALKERRGARVDPCGSCGGLWLVDALALPGAHCSHCKALERQRHDEARGRPALRGGRGPRPASAPQQQSLFGAQPSDTKASRL